MTQIQKAQSSSRTKSFLEPEKILDQIGITSGMRVADFGVGAGHFTLEAARRVGVEGTVYALDILPQALESVESQATMESLDNIETMRVNLEKEGGAQLEDASLDMVIAKDMLFMNKDKELIVREIARVLALGGKALLVEWNDDADNTIGPPKEKRVAPEQMIAWAHNAGLTEEQAIDVGDYHYGYVVTKQ